MVTTQGEIVMASLVKKENSKFWFAAFRDKDGRQRRRSTKIEATYANRVEAEKIARTYEDVHRRKMTAKQVRQVIATLHEEITGEDLPVVTLSEHCDTWLDRKEPEIAPSSFSAYKATTQKLKDFLGVKANCDINEITEKDVLDFRNALSKTLAAKTVNSRLKILRMMFRDAVRDKCLMENPLEHVSAVKDSGGGSRSPFTLQELKRVMQHVDGEWKSMVKFGLYTGQRLGDIACLTWHNVDLGTETISLQTGKTGKRLIIPMSTPLKQHIESLPVGDNPDAMIHPDSHEIWKNAGGKASTLSNQFVKILEHAGLRSSTTHESTGKGRGAKRAIHRLSFHSLRHTAVSMMHAAGIPPATVQALVGHDSDAVHQVYTHVGEDGLKKATNSLPVI